MKLQLKEPIPPMDALHVEKILIRRFATLLEQVA